MSDVPPGDVLHELGVALLQPQAEDLAARWTSQTREMLLLGQLGDPDSEADVATGLVDMLIGSASVGEEIPEGAIAHGLHFGASAFARGVSLHHVMKALDLLAAMTLHAVEFALDRAASATATTSADGVRLARRLQRRSALLSSAAVRGYMQAYADALRDRFRHLRHDLRNPLGTIKSVLALMDDDSVPLEARVNPNFRAMATRNAKSLDELIADRLSDAAALLPFIAGHDVSVRAIVCAVRRELRADAERRGVTILVEQGGPHGQLDAAGLELLLHGALQAVLHECSSGDRLQVDFEHSAGRASVVVSREGGLPPLRDTSALERLAALARQIGATISVEGARVLVSLQFRPGGNGTSRSPERERSLSHPPGGLSDGEARHDVRSAREGHHGQPGAH